VYSRDTLIASVITYSLFIVILNKLSGSVTSAELLVGTQSRLIDLCFKKNWTPETFYYNFAKIDLISIKIDKHNLHMM